MTLRIRGADIYHRDTSHPDLIIEKLEKINKILMEYVDDCSKSHTETLYKLRAIAVKRQIERVEVDYE